MISAAWDWYYGSQDEELLAECQFGDPFPSNQHSNKDVCIRPATLSNGLQVTVFTQVKSRPKEETSLEKCSNRLKVLRHPNILRHIGIVVTETEVHLVTERVFPLYLQFETVDANEVSSGMYDIAQAINFMHEKAKLSHNSVSIQSIYVTEGGAWKLSNFENACGFSEATAPFLKGLTRLKEIIPPEEGDNMVAFPIENKYAHCRDIYALGILLGMFHDQTRFASGVKTQELQDLLEEILQKDYRERPKVSELLETEALSSEYIEIVNFLQSITLKSSEEKKLFFTQLIPRLKKECISDELIAKRIAKLLLSPVVMAENEAVEKIIPRLLTPIPFRTSVQSKGLISCSMFARYVIPQIVDLLEVKVLHVRLVLVTNFHRYVHMFDRTVLQDTVLPEILLGLHDANNQLVKASLHALADSVPIVGGDMIVGSEREKIFSFGMPKFNGAVLVDASSLAYEMKPKRKPKKVKKPSPQRPVTLLQLAMKRQKSPAKGTVSQRDLMLLKQSELASTLTASLQNGTVSHPSQEVGPSDVEEMSFLPPLSVPIPPISPPSTNTEKVQTEEKIEKFPQTPAKPIQEPEIETWASSASEDDWGEFETLDGNSQNKTKKSERDDGNNMLRDKKDSVKAGIPRNKRAQKVKVDLMNGNVQTDERLKEIIAITETHEKTQETGNLKDDLGSEFEISVKHQTQTKTDELDFFADMVPDIPARKIPILPPTQIQTRVEKRPESVAESTGTAPSTISSPNMSLAAADSADDEATDGWENDAITWDD